MMSSHRDAPKKKKKKNLLYGAKNPVMIFNLVVQYDRSRARCRKMRSRISVSMVEGSDCTIGKVRASPLGEVSYA